MSSDQRMPPWAIDALVEFLTATTSITQLLHASVTSWPKLPEGWGKFDDYLATLDRHRPAVGAILTRLGHETAQEANRIVTTLMEVSVWAKRQIEAYPCPREQVQLTCDRVAEQLVPFRQFLVLMRLAVTESAGSSELSAPEVSSTPATGEVPSHLAALEGGTEAKQPALIAPTGPHEEPRTEPTATMIHAGIRSDGAAWQVWYGQESGTYPQADYSALAVVAKLVANPNKSFSRAELRAEPDNLPREQVTLDDILDHDALTDLQRGIDELRRDMEKETDPLVQQENEDNLEKLLAEVRKATRPGGRKRKLGTIAAQRAWDTLTKALRRLWKRLRETGMPELADHLENAVRIDHPHITYSLPAGTPLHWSTGEESPEQS
jgi:hypothetical protein